MAAESRTSGPPGGVGAYGLRLENVRRAGSLLVPASPSWPHLVVRRRIGHGEAEGEWMTSEAAVVALKTGGEIRIDRRRSEALFVLPRPLGTQELVHPLLAPVGAVMAYWLERESFHASAFVFGGRAWGILGERGAGKSTTAAQLALAGVPILCDDLLVLDDGLAFAGPRSIDLRKGAAAMLGTGEALGRVGARDRWRLALDDVPATVPFGGWVFLSWGDDIGCAPAPTRRRLERLHGNRGTLLPPRNPAALLDLAALPSFELRRPRDWRALPRALELLLETLS
jgi:hypothetical protein